MQKPLTIKPEDNIFASDQAFANRFNSEEAQDTLLGLPEPLGWSELILNNTCFASEKERQALDERFRKMQLSGVKPSGLNRA